MPRTTDEKIRFLLPAGYSYGYIGNIERWGDDRAWFIFRDHPGRVGKAADRVGGYATAERAQLLPIARGIKFGTGKAA